MKPTPLDALRGILACVVIASAARAATFDFEAEFGQATTFSITNGGLTATFHGGPSNSEIYGVVQAIDVGFAPFNSITGMTLTDQTGMNGDKLIIVFSAPITHFHFNYALLEPGDLQVNLHNGVVTNGFINAGIVGFNYFTPSVPPGYTYQEGLASDQPPPGNPFPPFNILEIYSTVGGILVLDNLSTDPIAIPEPSAVAALLAGLVAVPAWWWRRRRWGRAQRPAQISNSGFSILNFQSR